MSKEKTSFLEDANSTGFSCCITSGRGEKTQISIKCRTEPGEPLTEVSIDDASSSQLIAVCDILDTL